MISLFRKVKMKKGGIRWASLSGCHVLTGPFYYIPAPVRGVSILLSTGNHHSPAGGWDW